MCNHNDNINGQEQNRITVVSCLVVWSFGGLGIAGIEAVGRKTE